MQARSEAADVCLSGMAPATRYLVAPQVGQAGDVYALARSHCHFKCRSRGWAIGTTA